MYSTFALLLVGTYNYCLVPTEVHILLFCMLVHLTTVLYLQRYMELVRKRIENVMTVMDVMGGATTELNVAATRHIRLFELIFSTTGKIRGMKVTISMLESLRINNVHE